MKELQLTPDAAQVRATVLSSRTHWVRRMAFARGGHGQALRHERSLCHMQAHQGFLRAFNSVTNATQTKNNIMQAWTTMSGVPAEAVTRWGAFCSGGPVSARTRHVALAKLRRSAVPCSGLSHKSSYPAAMRSSCLQGLVHRLQLGSGTCHTVRPVGPGHLPQRKPFLFPLSCSHVAHFVSKRQAGLWCRPR